MTTQRKLPVFLINQDVCLRSDATKIGIIRRVLRRKNGDIDYLVYFSHSDESWYSEGVLSPVERLDDSPRTVSLTDFLKDLTLIKLESQLTDTLYSYLGSRTFVEPYQFRPALKFLESPNQRILLADEVGLGKTIEAGIIYLELKARLDLTRILIVCPSGLRYKWRDEMLNRFDEEFSIMDTRDFLQFLDRYEQQGGNQRLKSIISLESIRREDIQIRINEVGLHLDLAIVDEAHHMRNPDTLSHDIGLTVSDNADAMLLLTATPVQLRSADLFYLLHILDEGEFESLPEFENLLEPNLHINRASQFLSIEPASFHNCLYELRKVESTTQRDRFLNNPHYHQLCGQLSDPGDPNQKQLVDIRRGLQQLNTMAHVFNRTTKRDVDPGARRSANVVGVDLSPVEREFYEGVLDYVRSQYQSARSTSRTPPPFAIIQRERQAASCIAAARGYILDFIGDPNVNLEVESSEPELEDNEIPNISKNITLQRLIDICDRLGDTDSKLRLFIEMLGGIYSETPDSKVLVFSFFKRTLNYLQSALGSSKSQFRGSVWLIHGDIPQSQRRRIIEDFRTAPGFGILLLSEVGAEGLDFQFCDLLINYDLPWNPMRVEQRIGRIDRYGQTHERIRIFSFVINDTIEERILQRLYSRIRVFEESIGDLEPILGEEIAQLEREVFRTTLSPREEEEKIEAVLRSIEFKRQEADKFREEQKNLMGQDIIFSQQMEEIRSSGRYLSPNETKAIVEAFVRARFSTSALQESTNGDDIFVLKASPDFQRHLSTHITRNRYPIAVTSALSQKISNRLGLPITFDGEMALRRPLLEFLNFRHPIVAAAREYFQSLPRSSPISRLGKLQVVDQEIPTGEYAFFIYVLRGSGMERLTTLVPIVLYPDGIQRSEAVEARVMSSIQTAQEAPYPPRDWDWPGLYEKAYEAFAEIRNEQQEDLGRRNNALIDSRVTGLRQTYKFKVDRVQSQADQASDIRIRRMRLGQGERLLREMEAKLANLEERRDVAVGGELVSAGYIRVLASDPLSDIEQS